MNKILNFYRKTWWLWLLFVGIAVYLAMTVTVIYWATVPGILLYSLYFASIRGEETP